MPSFEKSYGVRVPNPRARRRWAKLSKAVRSWGSYPHKAPVYSRADAWRVYRGARRRRQARFYVHPAVRGRLAQRFYENARKQSSYYSKKRKRK